MKKYFCLFILNLAHAYFTYCSQLHPWGRNCSITKWWAGFCNSIIMFVSLLSITFLKSLKILFGLFIFFFLLDLYWIFINLSKICFLSDNSSIKSYYCAVCTFRVFFLWYVYQHSETTVLMPSQSAFSVNVSNQFLFWLPLHFCHLTTQSLYKNHVWIVGKTGSNTNLCGSPLATSPHCERRILLFFVSYL